MDLSDLMPQGLGHGIIVVALLFSEKRAARWTTAPLKQTNYQGKQPKKPKIRNKKKTVHNLNKQIKPYLCKAFEVLSMLSGFCLIIFL